MSIELYVVSKLLAAAYRPLASLSQSQETSGSYNLSEVTCPRCDRSMDVHGDCFNVRANCLHCHLLISFEDEYTDNVGTEVFSCHYCEIPIRLADIPIDCPNCGEQVTIANCIREPI
jgi:hypothetical protein